MFSDWNGEEIISNSYKMRHSPHVVLQNLEINLWKLREKLGYYYMPISDIQNDEGGSRSSLRDVMKRGITWFETSLWLTVRKNIFPQAPLGKALLYLEKEILFLFYPFILVIISNFQFPKRLNCILELLSPTDELLVLKWQFIL